MNATSEPSIMMDRPVLIPLPNFHLKASLPSDIAEFGTFRDTENYIPVRILIKATFVPSTYTFKPLTELPVTDDCHSNRNRPPTIFVLSWDTENYANEMTGPPAEMTVTQFQSVDLKVTVAPSLLHVGALSFPASFTANFATPETKYRHAFPFPLPSIMTSATARC